MNSAESEEAGRRIAELYAQGLGARKIAAKLQYKPGVVSYQLRRLGLVRAPEDILRLACGVPEITALPFRAELSAEFKDRSAAAQALATAWFLARGHHVSVPSNGGYCPYDLLVEAEGRMHKIQVKYTGSVAPSGAYVAKVCRCESRERTKVSYAEGEVDFVFIVTEPGTQYLIPREALRDKKSLTLDTVWSAYRV